MFLRELTESPKVAVTAFGRMNPPTKGHLKLIEKIKSIPGDHYLFLSQSVDTEKNPLPFGEKIHFAELFFDGIKIGDSEVRTPIQMMQKLEALGYDTVIFVAGADRVSSFKNLFDQYNGKEYNFRNIRIISAGDRDPDSDSIEGLSASKMRAAAINGNFDLFSQGVPDPTQSQRLYDAVRKGMNV